MSTTDHPARSGAMPGIAGVAGRGSRAFRAVLAAERPFLTQVPDLIDRLEREVG